MKNSIWLNQFTPKSELIFLPTVSPLNQTLQSQE